MRDMVLVVLMALMLAGCASSGRPIEQSQIDQVVVGKTTKAELLAIFGPPTNETVNSDGSQILGWGYAYAGFAGAGTKVQGLSVVLDANGTVSKYSRTGSTPEPARLGR